MDTRVAKLSSLLIESFELLHSLKSLSYLINIINNYSSDTVYNGYSDIAGGMNFMVKLSL